MLNRNRTRNIDFGTYNASNKIMLNWHYTYGRHGSKFMHDNNEIEKLEKVLINFQKEWKETQKKRSNKWRKHFLISFAVAVMASMLFPALWWTSLVIIAYFAGSLFTLLRQNAKTSNQILEHKKQLQLVRLLRNFESSPYSQK